MEDAADVRSSHGLEILECGRTSGLTPSATITRGLTASASPLDGDSILIQGLRSFESRS